MLKKTLGSATQLLCDCQRLTSTSLDLSFFICKKKGLILKYCYIPGYCLWNVSDHNARGKMALVSSALTEVSLQ